MTGKQLAALYRRYLRAALPGSAIRGSLLYMTPVGDLLRGCHFETGFRAERFVVHAFVQPLYVPVPALDLTYGRRLGGRGEQWFDLSEQPEEQAMGEVLRLIQAQALPLFSRFREPADFARHGAELVSNPAGPAFLEAVAYSYVIAGAPDEARPRLAALLTALQGQRDPLPYEREMLRRNQQLVVKLRDRPEQAVADLRVWRGETLRAIGIRDAASGDDSS